MHFGYALRLRRLMYSLYQLIRTIKTAALCINNNETNLWVSFFVINILFFHNLNRRSTSQRSTSKTKKRKKKMFFNVNTSLLKRTEQQQQLVVAALKIIIVIFLYLTSSFKKMVYNQANIDSSNESPCLCHYVNNDCTSMYVCLYLCSFQTFNFCFACI